MHSLYRLTARTARSWRFCPFTFVFDPRISRTERRFLEAIATKLREPSRGSPLPPGYQETIEQAFGSCGEGEKDRWQP